MASSPPSMELDQLTETENDDEQNGTISAIQLTPQSYAQKILAFSKRSVADSLYSGRHYSTLARWLFSPFQRLTQVVSGHDSDEISEFATLYNLSSRGSGPSSTFTKSNDLWEYDFNTGESGKSNQFLFIRGYPSPMWINTIGAKYSVDPEFFLRHLEDLVGTMPQPVILPSLPHSADIIQLNITTIGSFNDSRLGVSLEALRHDCEASMKSYSNQLARRAAGISTAYPIVRKFSVHDRIHFSMKQKISVYLSLSTIDNQWAVIVWLDNGNDLSTTLCGPWLRDRNDAWGISLHPVVQYSKHMALRRHVISPIQPDQSTTEASLHQSAAHLHLDFRSTLLPELVEVDPFYALHEIFAFSAAAESQLLNMMEQKVKAAAEITSDRMGDIGDLKSAKDILDEHVCQLQDTLEVIQRRGGARWPRAEDPRLAQIAANDAIALGVQYTALLRTAKRLSEMCETGITTLMSFAAHREAQKGIEQGRAVIKLSLMAFFFIPLSFTTSFFGMNVTELSDSRLSIWVWFLASVPILILSFSYWFIGPIQVRKVLFKWCRKSGD